MAKRGPHPKLGKMEPPAYSLCPSVPGPPEWLSDIGRAEWMVPAQMGFSPRHLRKTIYRRAITKSCSITSYPV